jgi:hypothetical protein
LQNCNLRDRRLQLASLSLGNIRARLLLTSDLILMATSWSPNQRKTTVRNLLLGIALIAAPVGMFAGAHAILLPSTVTAQTAGAAPAANGPALGDMSAFAAIITDVQSISATGDFTAAEQRITDFEAAWDAAAGRLRPVNATYWGNVDIAADAALDALRAGKPEAAFVGTTLADLQAELADPARMPGAAPVAAMASVAGVSTTDANGRALPCEVMLKDLSGRLATATVPAGTMTQISGLQAKALERCNADDDARADAFAAQALALVPASL